MPVPSNIQAFFFRDFANSYIPDILEEIYKKRVYTPYLTGRKDLTIVDFGANIGLTSYYFKDYAKQVYAVEPAKEHIEILQKMFAHNNIKNVTICPFAISNQNGTTKFYHNDNVTMYSMEATVNKKDDFEEVETVTIKEFMKRYKLDHIDLLKMDLEGSEGLVLSSPEFAEVAPKIKVVVGEWHSWCPMGRDLFMNTFRDLGYSFHWRTDTDASVFEATYLGV